MINRDFNFKHFVTISSVQFRRLTSKSWSALCSAIQDAYQGGDSIRAYSAVSRFRGNSCRVVDASNESYLAENVVNRWTQINMDIITDSAIFIVMLVAILVADSGSITPGILAMVISSGFSVGVFRKNEQFFVNFNSFTFMWLEVKGLVIVTKNQSLIIRRQHTNLYLKVEY